MTWSRGLVTGFLLAGVLLFTVACNPDGTSSQPNGNVIFNQTQTSHGCTGSQTVTVQNGDTLTVLVENHVSGSFSVEQVAAVRPERGISLLIQLNRVIPWLARFVLIPLLTPQALYVDLGMNAEDVAVGIAKPGLLEISGGCDAVIGL